MNWQQICENPNLQNLPFKIELNEFGKIVMTPVKVCHSALQGEIEHQLRLIFDTGRTLPECAIGTGKGTKVADVAWTSAERFEQIKNDTECSIAPEICIEVLSASNSDQEMNEKKALYFENGAIEVWICDEHGNVRFFNRQKESERSILAPQFPVKIII